MEADAEGASLCGLSANRAEPAGATGLGRLPGSPRASPFFTMDVARSPTVAVVVAAAATLFPYLPLIWHHRVWLSNARRLFLPVLELLEHDRRPDFESREALPRSVIVV